MIEEMPVLPDTLTHLVLGNIHFFGHRIIKKDNGQEKAYLPPNLKHLAVFNVKDIYFFEAPVLLEEMLIHINSYFTYSEDISYIVRFVQ